MPESPPYSKGETKSIGYERAIRESPLRKIIVPGWGAKMTDKNVCLPALDGFYPINSYHPWRFYNRLNRHNRQ